jgi:hypothetical protein
VAARCFGGRLISLLAGLGGVEDVNGLPGFGAHSAGLVWLERVVSGVVAAVRPFRASQCPGPDRMAGGSPGYGLTA